MGICCSSSADNPTPTTTARFSSVISQTSSNTASSSTSRGSRFSASSGDHSFPNGQILPAPDLRIFSFAELKSATKNFRPEMVLGEGGFGKVFKGWLDEKTLAKSGSGNLVAVKKLNNESLQGFEEWQSEISFLGRLSHPHLVRLIGYCLEDKELLLVYEFMQKGSLENHLFGSSLLSFLTFTSWIIHVSIYLGVLTSLHGFHYPGGSTVQTLEWNIRLKVVIGAAKGLSFLHTSDKQVIYRDFKASNILLDGSYTPKISDFGLAKLGPSASQSHVTTRVMGTYGYAAPEYVTTGHLYVKSDVYGFGVVLVEILTGLRALDPNRPSGQHNLVDWVKPYLSERRKLKKIMDQRLEGKYPSKAAYRIAQLALNCLECEPKNRPSMKEVVETLEQIESTNEKPKESRNRSAQRTTRKHSQQPSQRRSTLAPKHEAGLGYKTPPRGS